MKFAESYRLSQPNSKYHTNSLTSFGIRWLLLLCTQLSEAFHRIAQYSPKITTDSFCSELPEKRGLSQADIEHVNFTGRSFLSVIFPTGGKHNSASSNENLHWIKFFLFGQ